MTRWLFMAVLALALPSSARAEPLRCDLTLYKPSKGLTAAIAEGLLVVSWQGDRGRELRMRLTVSENMPMAVVRLARNSGPKSSWYTACRASVLPCPWRQRL